MVFLPWLEKSFCQLHHARQEYLLSTIHLVAAHGRAVSLRLCVSFGGGIDGLR
jgi:hypothetical protein